MPKEVPDAAGLLPRPGPPGPAGRVPGRSPRGLARDDRRAADAGWANYSLFLADDGLLVGYLETDDFDAARQRMEQTGVNDRWQAEMAPFFADTR